MLSPRMQSSSKVLRVRAEKGKESIQIFPLWRAARIGPISHPFCIFVTNEREDSVKHSPLLNFYRRPANDLIQFTKAVS